MAALGGEEGTSEVVACLTSIGCCRRCIMRMCGVDTPAAFLAPSTHPAAKPFWEGEGAEGFTVCSSCLGVMDAVCDPAHIASIREAISQANIEAPTYAVDISIPLTVPLRQRGAAMYASDALGNSHELRQDLACDLKVVVRTILYHIIGEDVSKRDDDAAYRIHVSFLHELGDRGAWEFLGGGPGKRRRDDRQAAPSLRAVLQALGGGQGSRAGLQRAGFVPPTAPGSPCSVGVKCTHLPVHILGRYKKFSRALPQTPWWLDGERKGSSSVQELMAPAFMKEFAAESTSFHGAGREDVDVRMLGKGRPFVLEIQQPHRVPAHIVPGCCMQHVAKVINASTEDIEVWPLHAPPLRTAHPARPAHPATPPQVSDVRVTSPSTVAGLVRDGEKGHRKAYRCIVWTSRAVTQADVDSTINEARTIPVLQKTPIRVLHRRPLHTRPRLVHRIHAQVINAHYMTIDLETQAGTYVKEFVHGDFGRTVPNVGSLLGCAAEILQLDVVGILEPEAGDEVDGDGESGGE